MSSRAPDARAQRQLVADEVEQQTISRYVAGSALFHALFDTVEEAARRADALDRLDSALKGVPASSRAR